MKEFYGNLSIVMNMNFNGVKADSLEEATKIILEKATFDFKLYNEETGEEIETDMQGWHIADEVGIGNVLESDLCDFSIEEEIS